MNPLRVIHRLLLAVACVCGLSSTGARAAMGDQPLPVLTGELQHMLPNTRNETLLGRGDEFFHAFGPECELKRQWLKQQWASLSPEQREQLRLQVREHWQRMSPEQRQYLREVHQDSLPFNGAGRQEMERQQRLSPGERQEFHHWMRERRGGTP